MNAHICPTCGQPTPEPVTPGDLDPVAQLLREYEQACVRNKYVVRGGKVNEATAAELVGWRKRPFANLRRSDNGPVYYDLSIEGSKYAYKLKELAEWEVNQRNGESWS